MLGSFNQGYGSAIFWSWICNSKDFKVKVLINFNIFKDDIPVESFFLYGYLIKTKEHENGCFSIELSHENQFQTDEQKHKIMFEVIHPKSAAK